MYTCKDIFSPVNIVKQIAMFTKLIYVSLKDKSCSKSFDLYSVWNKKEVLLLGDSTVCGTNLKDYSDSLAHKFFEKGYNTTKIGKPMYKITDLVKLIDRKKYLLIDRKYDLTCIFIGANDLMIPCTNFTVVEKKLNNLFNLITKYKSNLGNILFMSKGDNTGMGALVYPYNYILQKKIDKFDNLAQKVCYRHNITFFELSNKLSYCANNCRTDDGLHLNGNGFDIVASEILKYYN